MSLTASQQALLESLSSKIALVDGVVAVALGGSHAAGSARRDSDLDLGLYYRDEEPLDVDGLRALAEDLDPAGASSLTELGRWGPWMDGGAWLTIDGQRVDWIYRSIDRLGREIDAAERGEHQWHAAQQPPFGFVSGILLGELAICRPLHDPLGALA